LRWQRDFKPGCLLRSTLAICGVVFLPISVWFRHNWFRHTDQWVQGMRGIVLIIVLRSYSSVSRSRGRRNHGSSAVDDL
jgi:hypothetical protein